MNHNKTVPEKNKKTEGSVMEELQDPQVGSASSKEEEEEGEKPRHIQIQDEILRKLNEARTNGLEVNRMALQATLGLDERQRYVEDEWSLLRGRIWGFAKEAFFTGITWDKLDEATRQKFIGYSPRAEELFMIQDMSFFSQKSKDIEWTSTYWEAQATLERILWEENFPYRQHNRSIQYPYWRFTTMQFYYESRSFYVTRIKPNCVEKTLKKALGQILPEKLNAEQENFLLRLGQIVAKLEHDFDFGRAAYCIAFDHPETKEAYGFPFSPNLQTLNNQVMKSVEPGQDKDLGRPVDLVVSPMLVKYGNEEGYDFHFENVVSPMKVCIAWLEDFEKEDGEEELLMVKEKEDRKDEKE
ncbi:hypothetical protein IL306_014189 [Fusarium sp. DS 682]|nr:hypothetical protein IL306_014189 [Fusarium sp. DS 682]